MHRYPGQWRYVVAQLETTYLGKGGKLWYGNVKTNLTPSTLQYLFIMRIKRPEEPRLGIRARRVRKYPVFYYMVNRLIQTCELIHTHSLRSAISVSHSQEAEMFVRITIGPKSYMRSYKLLAPCWRAVCQQPNVFYSANWDWGSVRWRTLWYEQVGRLNTW